MLTKLYIPGAEQENRIFDLDLLEVRADKEGEVKKIRGHAAVYNKLSEDMGGFREMMEPGAFTETIARDDIRSLLNHTPNYILGRNKAGTLKVEEEVKGVYYEITPPDTRYARDLMVSIERGDVSQCSIIFQIDSKKGERWLVDGEEKPAMDAFAAMWGESKHKIERHVMKARLFDVGPVTFPAYPQTDVKIRDYISSLKETQDKPGEPGSLNRSTDSLVRLKWKLR
jgi:uncharacterized protein